MDNFSDDFTDDKACIAYFMSWHELAPIAADAVQHLATPVNRAAIRAWELKLA